MKILIQCPLGIGDALMYTPVLRLLRSRYSGAVIDVLTPLKAAAEIFQLNPDVSNVLFWDFLNRSKVDSLKFVMSLRRQRYDVSIAVYPQNRWEYNAITRLIGAPRRLGHTYNHQNLRQGNFLNTHTVRELDERHNVEENALVLQQYLDVSEEPLPGLHMTIPEEAAAAARHWRAQRHFSEGTTLIGIHAGSSTMKNHINKRWPPDRFAELGRRLAVDRGAVILLFGGPEEAALKQAIADTIGEPAIPVHTGSILETAAVMQMCDCFISNDSSLMHIAAALQLKTVGIAGPTNERYAYPWGTQYRIAALHDLPCRPCFYYSPRPVTCILQDRPYACVRNLQVETVLNLVCELLDEA